MTDKEQRVREVAYQIWEDEGRPDNHAVRHWGIAEKIVDEHLQQSGSKRDVAIDDASVFNVPEGSPSAQRTKAKVEKQMDICAHMEVVDADGQHVGIVEKVEGDRIKLTEKDALDPQHLFLDKSEVADIEGDKVKLSRKESAVTTRAFLSPER
jgi:hypothetical protein